MQKALHFIHKFHQNTGAAFAFFIVMAIGISAQAQTLPIDFESGVTTENFINFDGGEATVIPNPQMNADNPSGRVAQIVRNGGQVWGGSKIRLSQNLNFSTDNLITMKVFTSAPVGTVVKLKLENASSAAEVDVVTTVSNAWETLVWDFTGRPSIFNEIVFMFDFGRTGNGSATSTFLFDDITQEFGGTQIDLPVTFNDPNVNYTMTDFGGNVSMLVTDPTNPSNNVIQVVKTNTAASWAGTTIGTNAGFATNIPLSLTQSKMTVKVWSPTAGTPIRLKVEDANDVTHTCETEVLTTVAQEWETLEFNFATEAPGTARLDVGLSMGWKYNKASIFFNFGTEGAAAGERTYFFDEVRFGDLSTRTTQYDLIPGLVVAPNPTQQEWTFKTDHAIIHRIDIFNIQGQQMMTAIDNGSFARIDASTWTSGVYIARIYSAEGTQSVRLVKQ